MCVISDVGSYLKLSGQVVKGGAQTALSVDIGLTDLPKSWWAIAHPAYQAPKSLLLCSKCIALG